ncbi:hypothetical protein JW877_08675, partial [bacterium]|nr:hypothetical protein [bacterium]
MQILSDSLFGALYDTFRICLEAFDNAGFCGANGDTLCHYIYIDAEGPHSWLLLPPLNTYTACNFQNLYFYINDPNGINPASIQVLVNGVVYEIGDLELRYFADTLRFVPSLPWSDGETVSGSLYTANDIHGNPLESMSYFQFTVDLSPPYFRDQFPAYGGVVTTLSPEIGIVVLDEIGEVNWNSLIINYGGDSYTLSDPGIYREDSLLRLDMVELSDSLSGGDTIFICLQIQDSVDFCSPHIADTCWLFYIASSPPIAEIREPFEGAISACPDQSILVYIFDTEGIDTASILIAVNGIDYDLASDELELISDSLILFSPSSPYPEGESLTVCVNSLNDVLGNPLPLPVCSYFHVDLSPPGFLSVPGHGARLSDTLSNIEIEIWDDFSEAGWDSLQVAGIWYVTGDPGISWTPPGLVFDPAAAGIERLPDTLNVCLAVCDAPDYCEPNCLDSCWVFYISTEPPDVWLINPEEGSVSSCPDQNAVFFFRDEDDIQPNSIELEVNDSLFRYPHPYLNFSNDTLCFEPGYDFEHNDTIRFLLTAEDTLGNMISPPFTAFFLIDLEPPEIIFHYPLNNEIVYDTLQPVTIIFDDTPAGIDPSSLSLEVAGRTYSSEVFWDGDTMIFYPLSLGIVFNERDTILVSINDLADSTLYCAPNHIPDSYQWSFIIGDDDTICPEFSEFQPQAVFQGDTFLISCLISDTSGIFAESTYVLWDIDGSLSNGGEQVTPMEIDPSGPTGPVDFNFITSDFLPGLSQSDDFVYSICAYDNDFDHNNPADRYKCFSDEQVVFSGNARFHYGPACSLGSITGDELFCIGDTAWCSGVLVNLGQANIILEDAYFGSQDFQVRWDSGVTLPGDSVILEIGFLPQQEGEFSDTLILAYSISWKDTAWLYIPFSGTAVDCYAEFSALPNPFTPNGDNYNDYVYFTIPNPYGEKVTITIYNYNNMKVTTIEGEGTSAIWDGRDDQDREMRPGVYF